MQARLALLVVVAACGHKKQDTRACDTAAAEVGEYLRDIEWDVLQPQRMTLALRDDLPHGPPPTTVTVIATPTGITYYGNAADNDLPERLAAAHAKLAADAKAGSLPPYIKNFDVDAALLELDAAVPWSTVVKVASAAQQAGFVHPIFVFARTSPNKKPPPSKLDGDIAAAAADPSGHATAFAALARRVVKPCPALDRTLSGPTGVTPEVLATVPDALVECSCAVDPASVRNLFVAWLGTTWPVSFATMQVAPGSPPLEYAGDTPWSQIAPRLAADSTVGGFAVKPQ